MEKLEIIKNIFSQKWFLISLDIILSIVIFSFIAYVLNKTLNKIFKSIEDRIETIDRKKQINTIKIVVVSSIDTIICAILLMHILLTLGIDIRPILATAGVLGLAVGFAGKKFVEDLISGLLLLLEEQIRVGDIVKIQGTLGTVERVNLRLVMLRDWEGTVHYYRNSMIDTVSNYSKDFSYAFFTIGVAYKENIVEVMEVIKRLGKEFRQHDKYKKLVTDDVEIWGLDSFDDSSIIIKFRIRTLPSKQWLVLREFNLKLKEEFDKLGIEIPFPQRVLTINNSSPKDISL